MSSRPSSLSQEESVELPTPSRKRTKLQENTLDDDDDNNMEATHFAGLSRLAGSFSNLFTRISQRIERTSDSQERTELQQQMTVLLQSQADFIETHLKKLLPTTLPGSGYKEPMCREPKVLSVVASEASFEDICCRSFEGEIYHHWFAVALYNLKTQLQELIELRWKDPVTFTFKGMEMSIPRSQLNNLIKKWQLHREDWDSFTSVISVELDRFLFPQDGKDPIGGCFHRLPLNSCTRERSVISVVPYSGLGKYDLNGYVAIADFEKELGDNKSMAFNLKGQTGHHELVRLIFPCTKHSLNLSVTIPMDENLLSISVCKASLPPWLQLDARALAETFFCMLYAGVHYLLANPIKSDGFICPTPDLKLVPMQEPNIKSTRWFGRLYCSRLFCDSNDNVYKLFDTKENESQVEVAQLVLDEAKEVTLTEDGRYRYLKYHYRVGDHLCESMSTTQLYQLLNQLHKIHEKGYVHSDIRFINTVCNAQEDKAWIIDFDLADKEGERYPSGYNGASEISERHPEAKSTEPRKKIHDVYSLSKITDYPSILKQYEQGKSLLDIRLE